jgi:hypothetical protein
MLDIRTSTSADLSRPQRSELPLGGLNGGGQLGTLVWLGGAELAAQVGEQEQGALRNRRACLAIPLERV